MIVPMADLAAQHADIAEEVEAGFRAVLETGQFVLGPQAAAFEEEAAAYLGVAHAVGCASGTDALYLALRGLGIGPGDEVVTTPFTFFGTVEAICDAGARPVFVDIDSTTFNLDPTQVAAALTPATRALLPVHLYGQPAALEPLLALADRHGLAVVEDCAQAFGARRGGRAAGSLGQAGCFSFFPNKNLGAYGDGGMVATDSGALAAGLRELRNHGSSERHKHRVIGRNSRLDDLQAVVLRAKLKRIDEYNRIRQQIARRYSDGLAGLPGVTTPSVDPGGTHVYHQYTLQLPERDRVYQALQAQGIACAIHYPGPLYRQPALAEDYPGIYLPVTETVSRRCLSLPIYPGMGDERIDRVIAALHDALVTGNTAR